MHVVRHQTPRIQISGALFGGLREDTDNLLVERGLAIEPGVALVGSDSNEEAMTLLIGASRESDVAAHGKSLAFISLSGRIGRSHKAVVCV